MDLKEMQQEAWQTSEDHGFHDGPDQLNIPTKLMLICCEVAEAMEEFRDGSELSYHVGQKPEGISAELADVVIRVGDLCGILGIDLDLAVQEKMMYNKTRQHKHGKIV